jgi:hypothetical protein
MRDLQLIRDQALQAGAYGAAVQAEYRRGQALGTIYIDRKEIRHGTIDSMSKEEVMRKLEEIRRLYGQGGGPVIDITPRQLESDPELAELPDTAPAEDPEDDSADERPPENGEPHASETGEPPVQPGPGKPRKLPYIPD